ncbi:MAG: hypothetical protein M3Y08_07090 [Fibrobacterota bacterium]|nr:hypothetical protein [Fibrobacterota bacterium]
MRIAAPLITKLEELLSNQDKPPMRVLLLELAEFCRQGGYSLPSRATCYNFMSKARTPRYLPATLPQAARAALYNLDADTAVPGHQLAFYCFNYGDLRAMSYAAGLPWLVLYQAARMRGFRPKSRGLLEAVLRARDI